MSKTDFATGVYANAAVISSTVLQIAAGAYARVAVKVFWEAVARDTAVHAALMRFDAIIAVPVNVHPSENAEIRHA